MEPSGRLSRLLQHGRVKRGLPSSDHTKGEDLRFSEVGLLSIRGRAVRPQLLPPLSAKLVIDEKGSPSVKYQPEATDPPDGVDSSSMDVSVVSQPEATNPPDGVDSSSIDVSVVSQPETTEPPDGVDSSSIDVSVVSQPEVTEPPDGVDSSSIDVSVVSQPEVPDSLEIVDRRSNEGSAIPFLALTELRKGGLGLFQTLPPADIFRKSMQILGRGRNKEYFEIDDDSFYLKEDGFIYFLEDTGSAELTKIDEIKKNEIEKTYRNHLIAEIVKGFDQFDTQKRALSFLGASEQLDIFGAYLISLRANLIKEKETESSTELEEVLLTEVLQTYDTESLEKLFFQFSQVYLKEVQDKLALDLDLNNPHVLRFLMNFEIAWDGAMRSSSEYRAIASIRTLLALSKEKSTGLMRGFGRLNLRLPAGNPNQVNFETLYRFATGGVLRGRMHHSNVVLPENLAGIKVAEEEAPLDVTSITRKAIITSAPMLAGSVFRDPIDSIRDYFRMILETGIRSIINAENAEFMAFYDYIRSNALTFDTENHGRVTITLINDIAKLSEDENSVRCILLRISGEDGLNVEVPYYAMPNIADGAYAHNKSAIIQAYLQINQDLAERGIEHDPRVYNCEMGQNRSKALLLFDFTEQYLQGLSAEIKAQLRTELSSESEVKPAWQKLGQELEKIYQRIHGLSMKMTAFYLHGNESILMDFAKKLIMS